MDAVITGAVTIALALIGVAALATFFSKNAATSQVIQAGGSALALDINAATGPVSGGSGSGLNLPNLGNFNFGGNGIS